MTALGEATAADVAAALVLIRQDRALTEAFQALDSAGGRLAFIRSCAETEARTRTTNTEDGR